MAELAGYEFVQTVGKGAMGAVYLARQTVLNRYVAAKQILGAWNGDPEALARFQREAQALARMNHPNVVAIYDLAASGSDLFMIMEYVRGPSLRQLMDRSPLNTAQALRVLAEVAAALEYASRQSIIHRDLKPGNVFVTAGGVCKLGDFGLVKMLSGQAIFVTQVGTILGTPAYMSPEQASGKPDIDQRADVYALSVMAYEMLVGRLPFPSIPGNVMASLDAHISAPVPRPSTIVPGFPKKVEEVLLEGLAKDPKKRPKTAGELWKKLSAAADKAWPGWAAGSDLAVIATAASPPAPPPLPTAGTPVSASASMLAAPLPPQVVPPPPPPPAPPMVPLPAGDETVVLGAGGVTAAPIATDETVVLGTSPDETVVLGGPSAAGDQTVVLGGPPAGAPALAGGPVFAPPPPAPAFAAPPPAPGVTPPPATGGVSLPPPPASGSWAAPMVAPPVYQPPKAAKPKRRGGAVRLISLLLILIIVGGVGYITITRLHVLGGGTALAVSGVTVTVDQPTGHCPSFAYKFTGKVASNGAGGQITYQWVKPDGTTSDTASVTIPSGDKESTATLQFTFQGNGHGSGDATLRVISPTDVKSAPVHVEYQCP